MHNACRERRIFLFFLSLFLRMSVREDEVWKFTKKIWSKIIVESNVFSIAAPHVWQWTLSLRACQAKRSFGNTWRTGTIRGGTNAPHGACTYACVRLRRCEIGSFGNWKRPCMWITAPKVSLIRRRCGIVADTYRPSSIDEALNNFPACHQKRVNGFWYC